MPSSSARSAPGPSDPAPTGPAAGRRRRMRAAAFLRGRGTLTNPGLDLTRLPIGLDPRGLSLVDVRRLWPDILEQTKNRRRLAWMVLSQHAHVVDVDFPVVTNYEGDRAGAEGGGVLVDLGPGDRRGDVRALLAAQRVRRHRGLGGVVL